MPKQHGYGGHQCGPMRKRQHGACGLFFVIDRHPIGGREHLRCGRGWRLDEDTGQRSIQLRGQIRRIRRAEFAKAKRGDVVGDTLRVESTEDGRTKSGRWREVPLNREAKEALKHPGDDRLSWLTSDALTRWFRDAANEAGVKGQLHMLRHTFCSHLVMAGVSLRVVQVLAGYSSYSVTERYAHLAPEDKTKAVNLIRL